MTFRTKLIVIAYLPTLVVALAILIMLIVYFSGWRIWVLVPPVQPATPTVPIPIVIT